MSERFAFICIQAGEAVTSVAGFASACVGTIRIVAVCIFVAVVRADRTLVDVHAFAVLLLISAETGAFVGAYCIDTVGVLGAEEGIDCTLIDVGTALAVSSVASFARA